MSGFLCGICGFSKEHRPEREYELMGCCSDCARVIANWWCHAHSGSFLTWENAPCQQNLYVKTPIPEALRWQVFERDGFQCKHCGSKHFLRADHIFPESKGGKATLENLQTLCRSCNSKKKDKLPE